ncbi:Glyoxalase/Bleomycin resistance protein/Dihydroxybiphenyl dioxygenase [Hypoxylon sp. EC38]|nr:Glyoxalase/Bleomycin resistance protein/Dihydroxybiphenyl dioxygenase [Hypoxylon sp. EC38]OTA96527.1 hypothetical protein M434DRAFT_104671 [Hypoxylon sp. CO27-5]
MSKQYNHAINHMGLSVPNLEEALKWYTEVLGFVSLGPTIVEDRSVNPDTAVFRICPPGFNKVKVAYLTTGNGVGLELFEFLDPRMDPNLASSFESGRDFRRGGIFHFAVTVPDVEAMAKKAEQHGGKRIAQTVRVFGEDGVYIQDPWGNGIEVISTSWEQLLCNRSTGNLVVD